MVIKEASESDIDGILKVLKASLGETSSKKTESVWRYKHVENPFGESLVLIAKEDGAIIGVRAFMRWRWQKGEKVYSAFRAVDTATHPDHQGKGVFKRLTLKALDLAKQRGDHFVFNTPNTQSLPGYIKMGWERIDKLKVELIPVNPLKWKNTLNNLENYKVLDQMQIDYLEDWENKNKGTGKLFTPKSLQYLEWRYLNNPLQNYQVFCTDTYFIAGYLKQHGSYCELRISELIYSSEAQKSQIKKVIRNWGNNLGVQVISVHIPLDNKLFIRSVTGKFGPVFTFRNIDLDLNEYNYLDLNTWGYSLGDLELF